MKPEIWGSRIVFPDQQVVLESFNEKVLPYLKAQGSRIGERAMQGDVRAEAVIHRYKAFEGWMDERSLKALEASIRVFEERGSYHG